MSQNEINSLQDLHVDQLIDTRELLIQRFFAVDPSRVDAVLQRRELQWVHGLLTVVMKGDLATLLPGFGG